jgi:hypothetical protein
MKTSLLSALTISLLAIAVLLVAVALRPAHAQRCPAGQDQFHNCYSLDPGMRAKHERWATQPAARQIPGAQPYGSAASAPIPATSATPMYREVPYQLQTPSGPVTIVHHRDGKRSMVTTADGSRFTLVARACGSDWCIYRDGRFWRRTPR